MNQKKFDEIYQRCFKAIASCKTFEQVETAGNYLSLFMKLVSKDSELKKFECVIFLGGLTGALMMKAKSFMPEGQNEGN
jgi:hypothetical protein